MSGPVKASRFDAVQAVVTLRAQYRMSSDIMAIPNALVYNGALAAGSAAVASRALRLPQLDATAMSPWLQKVDRTGQICRVIITHVMSEHVEL